MKFEVLLRVSRSFLFSCTAIAWHLAWIKQTQKRADCTRFKSQWENFYFFFLSPFFLLHLKAIKLELIKKISFIIINIHFSLPIHWLGYMWTFLQEFLCVYLFLFRCSLLFRRGSCVWHFHFEWEKNLKLFLVKYFLRLEFVKFKFEDFLKETWRFCWKSIRLFLSNWLNYFKFQIENLKTIQEDRMRVRGSWQEILIN